MSEKQGFRGRVKDVSTGLGRRRVKVNFYGCALDPSTKPPQLKTMEESVASDFQGNYTIALPVGAYMIWVKQTGFEVFHSNFYLLPPKEYKTVNISLKPSTCAPVTTVYVIRHAEYIPGSPGSDPPLNQAGRERREQLLRVLCQADVNVIFHTQFRRTQETAQPLVLKNSISPIAYQKDDVQGLVQQIWANHRGKNILIVGHSDTVPEIIRILVPEGTTISIGLDFHHLFIVTLCEQYIRNVEHLWYGATPACV